MPSDHFTWLRPSGLSISVGILLDRSRRLTTEMRRTEEKVRLWVDVERMLVSTIVHVGALQVGGNSIQQQRYEVWVSFRERMGF